MTYLLHLPYSPWSERARWALDLRGLDVPRKTYAPLLGEPALRFQLRKLRGTVSVPVLFGAGAPVEGSWAIARWANQHGDGPDLFPAEHLAKIEAWNQCSDRALDAGRGLSLARVSRDKEALAELLPGPLRSLLGTKGAPIARFGVWRTLHKYGADPTAADRHRAVLRQCLLDLRADLAAGQSRGEPRTLLPTVTYADITLAQALVFVRPPDAPWLPLGPANRKAFGDEELAREFADLLTWRDDLYQRWRRPVLAGPVGHKALENVKA